MCTLVGGVPVAVKRARSRNVGAGRKCAGTRAREITEHLLEGTAVLLPGDFDLTEGGSVRLYLDGELMPSNCPVDLKFWDA